MIHLHSDAFSNFSSAVDAGGNNLAIDLFANELSDLIIGQTPKLVDTLNKVGVNVSLNMSDEEIVDNVIESIGKDDKVIKAIGFTIAENNGLVNNPKTTSKDWTKAINAIVLSLIPASKEITQSVGSKADAKQKVMKQIETKAKVKGDYKRVIWKPKTTSLGILLTLGLIAVVGVCAYFIYKKTQVIKPAPLNL